MLVNVNLSSFGNSCEHLSPRETSLLDPVTHALVRCNLIIFDTTQTYLSIYYSKMILNCITKVFFKLLELKLAISSHVLSLYGSTVNIVHYSFEPALRLFIEMNSHVSVTLWEVKELSRRLFLHLSH